MKCEKCKNSFYSKECPYCKEIAWKNNLNKDKNSKIKKLKINIPITIIAIAVSIIAIIMIRNEYVKHQEEKQIAKLLYGTDDYNEIEKINIKTMKQNEKAMKEFRKIYMPK